MICKFLFSVVMQGFGHSKNTRAGVEQRSVNLEDDVQHKSSQIQSGLLLTKVSQTKVPQSKLKSTDRFNELLAELRRQEELFYGRAKPLSVMDKN